MPAAWGYAVQFNQKAYPNNMTYEHLFLLLEGLESKQLRINMQVLYTYVPELQQNPGQQGSGELPGQQPLTRTVTHHSGRTKCVPM